MWQTDFIVKTLSMIFMWVSVFTVFFDVTTSLEYTPHLGEILCKIYNSVKPFVVFSLLFSSLFFVFLLASWWTVPIIWKLSFQPCCYVKSHGSRESEKLLRATTNSPWFCTSFLNKKVRLKIPLFADQSMIHISLILFGRQYPKALKMAFACYLSEQGTFPFLGRKRKS